MKHKIRLLPVVLIAVAILAAVIIVISVNGGFSGNDEPFSDGSITVDDSAKGLTVVSVDSIAGAFVEDGSDDVLNNIFTLTIRNDGLRTLQYAKLILKVGDESYSFEVSTLPAGASVRAMETGRKSVPSESKGAVLSAENIAWFDQEPSLSGDILKITPRGDALIIENISDSTVSGPVYVYYKNYSDGIFIGGITYRAGADTDIAPGQAIAVNAGHYDQSSSRLMFATFTP